MDTTDQETIPLKPEDKEIDPLEQARQDGARMAMRALLDRMRNYTVGFKTITEAQRREKPWAKDLKPAQTFFDQIERLYKVNQQALDENTLLLQSDPGDPYGQTLNTNILIKELEEKESETDAKKTEHDTIIEQANSDGILKLKKAA